MKKAMLIIVSLIIITCAGCKKTSISTSPQQFTGIWMFNNNTDTATSCSYYSQNGSGRAICQMSKADTFITLAFYDGYPISSGVYTVCYDDPPVLPHTVSVSRSYTVGNLAIYFSSTGGNGNNQTVSVSVSGGKTYITGSSIELAYSTAYYADSLPINFNVIQTR